MQRGLLNEGSTPPATTLKRNIRNHRLSRPNLAAKTHGKSSPIEDASARKENTVESSGAGKSESNSGAADEKQGSASARTASSQIDEIGIAESALARQRTTADDCATELSEANKKSAILKEDSTQNAKLESAAIERVLVRATTGNKIESASDSDADSKTESESDTSVYDSLQKPPHTQHSGPDPAKAEKKQLRIKKWARKLSNILLGSKSLEAQTQKSIKKARSEDSLRRRRSGTGHSLLSESNPEDVCSEQRSLTIGRHEEYVECQIACKGTANQTEQNTWKEMWQKTQIKLRDRTRSLREQVLLTNILLQCIMQQQVIEQIGRARAAIGKRDSSQGAGTWMGSIAEMEDQRQRLRKAIFRRLTMAEELGGSGPTNRLLQAIESAQKKEQNASNSPQTAESDGMNEGEAKYNQTRAGIARRKRSMSLDGLLQVQSGLKGRNGASMETEDDEEDEEDDEDENIPLANIIARRKKPS